jgi:hypothetical protein
VTDVATIVEARDRTATVQTRRRAARPIEPRTVCRAVRRSVRDPRPPVPLSGDGEERIAVCFEKRPPRRTRH